MRDYAGKGCKRDKTPLIESWIRECKIQMIPTTKDNCVTESEKQMK